MKLLTKFADMAEYCGKSFGSIDGFGLAACFRLVGFKDKKILFFSFVYIYWSPCGSFCFIRIYGCSNKMSISGLVIENYEHLENLLEDLIKVKCNICNKRTIHIMRGFNGRLCCLRCEERQEKVIFNNLKGGRIR